MPDFCVKLKIMKDKNKILNKISSALNANNLEAEQTVMHLHYHILPRFAGDNMKLYPGYPNNQRNLAEIQQKLQKDIK